MDPESAGGIPPSQTEPQQLQLLASAGTQPSNSELLKTFYKGEPLALGITQILLGILMTAFGILFGFVNVKYRPPYTQLMTQCWTGPLFITSGALCVAAAQKPRLTLVKGMLGMNVVSAVAAGLGLLFFAISFDEYMPMDDSFFHCSSMEDPETSRTCYKLNIIFPNIESGVMMVSLVFTIVELGLSITSAAFGCATVCRNTYDEKIVVVYQNTAQDNAVNFPPVVGDAETV